MSKGEKYDHAPNMAALQTYQTSFATGDLDKLIEVMDVNYSYTSTSQPGHKGIWETSVITKDKFREWYPKFREMNHDVGAGDKKGDMEYVISLDKIMVTEFQDFLVVCFTLGMPGVFASIGQQVYKGGKIMWDNLVNVPQGIDPLPIGEMKEFKMKDNYMSALLYSQGWASADVELMKTVQAKSHLFTVGDGQPNDVDHFAEAHSQFKDQISSLLNRPKALKKVVAKEWENMTFVTEELVGETSTTGSVAGESSTLVNFIFKDGLCIWTKVLFKQQK